MIAYKIQLQYVTQGKIQFEKKSENFFSKKIVFSNKKFVQRNFFSDKILSPTKKKKKKLSGKSFVGKEMLGGKLL